MNDRREFLAKFSTAAVGLVTAGVGAGALAKTLTPTTEDTVFARTATPGALHGPGQIPEVRAQTSRGKAVHLYADLIKGKVVLINYMAIASESMVPVTAKLLEIARRLGPKLGTEVHIVSITSDPEHDTPARLRAFEKKLGLPDKGWTFVRMSTQSSMVVTARLHRHAYVPSPHDHMSVVNYGNEPVGLWGMFPSGISIDDAMLRIASILPGKPVTGAPRRRGPRPLGSPGLPFNSRIA